ncbi:MAG: serine/threonine-protein kinase [Acidobacteriota bacterium]
MTTHFPPAEPSPSFPYRVQERIGIGSMGVVHKAIEVDLDRAVAIKTLRPSVLAEETPDVQAEMRRRFLQEAQAAGRVSHPGVTTVYRVGEHAGVPFMVMEWLEGRTLDAVMRAEGPLPAKDAAGCLIDLLDTLDAAHRVGVVHRDVKPSNVVLLDSGRLKVTDFGIARIQGKDLVQTQAGVVLATPKFASPEQLRGMEVDGRADVYASGVLLYYLLSGQYPFEGASFMELASAVLKGTALPISQLVDDLPPRLESIVHRALRTAREERYSSAAQMADDLRSVLQLGSTVVAEVIDPELETARSTLSIRGLPRDLMRALATFAESWPKTRLAEQDCRQLLDRLLERPLHAPAFSGAVDIGEEWFFLHDGVLLGAVRLGADEGAILESGVFFPRGSDHLRGDDVIESLPETVTPTLYPVPEHLPAGLLPVLCSVLHPPRLLHADLDSSYINLPVMAQKLRDDHFDGLLRLMHGGDWGLVLFLDGESVLSLYSEGWERIPNDSTWQRWVSEHPIRAQVEKKTVRPPAEWFRRAFPSLPFDIHPVEEKNPNGGTGSGTTSARLRHFLTSSRTGPLTSKLGVRLAAGTEVEPFPGANIPYDQAPGARFLGWALENLPRYFAERDLTSAWKYLADWLPLVRQARIYHPLKRPGAPDTDFFDLVTEDADGKVLHLAERQAAPTPESVATFHQKVVAAKTARRKTGDIGGVFLIAPHFDDEVLEAYRALLDKSFSKSWFGVEESFTGYAGFVRIGPRRGFHLLLVEEKDGEAFEPLPIAS